ncbi:hypothetical protein CKA34_21870 (plasmid) [Rhizobium sp. 11515TR]|nr:hypothetical protein CKA34_21870 [Rhizobium sp. 11515TR]
MKFQVDLMGADMVVGHLTAPDQRPKSIPCAANGQIGDARQHVGYSCDTAGFLQRVHHQPIVLFVV